ncbi:MAG: NAD(P)H-dependent oxidoreductase subunit E, partial [Deltaproteobacteria bacterium]|nr:NAD(P)H-dependent oxidoreductase subunit E [Deltaproteobacteria bacterium]
MKAFRFHALFCGCTACKSMGSLEVRKKLEAELAGQGLSDEVKVGEVGCVGYCAFSPIMIVYPGGIYYQKLTPEDVPELVSEHFIKGRPVERLFYREPKKKEHIPVISKIPFFANQKLVVLHNRGLINADKIDEYIARDGYQAVGRALTEMTPEKIIETVKASGLRERDGTGFPTGLKLEYGFKFKPKVKYIVCIAGEGDLGAFMDRSILEADPHKVIEGITIAARAVDAHYGYIYCEEEYSVAIARLNIAIAQATEYGLLGEDILDSGFNFNIRVREGKSIFRGEEESDIIASIEGEPEKPYISESDILGHPALTSNVETYANIPQIILRGPEWFASIGTEKSKGTKVFALTGDVYNKGLVEVPMGTKLKTIVYNIGGGIPRQRKLKGIQFGGPSSGCIPAKFINLPCDFESVRQVGGFLGAGGLIVMDNDTCMVDLARFYMDCRVQEPGGKCPLCQEGAKRALEILDNICEGKGEVKDLETLESLTLAMEKCTQCADCQTGLNPVLSTLKYYRQEYMAHILEKRCPAKRCPNLVEFVVDEERCRQCGACRAACPVGAITWQEAQPAYIDQ